jgi:anti-sigma factor RsiW
MREPIFKDNSMLEALFRQAVIENFERELEELEKEPDVAVSDRHKRRMEKLFAKARRENRVRVAVLWTKRFAAAAASLIIVLSGLLMTVSAVRASVGDAFTAFFSEYVRFGSDGAETPDAGVDWRPEFIPANYSETGESNPGAITVIRYADAGGNFIEFTYVAADNAMSANYEHIMYEQAFHDGVVYHKFSAESGEYKSAVVWDSDGYIFSVTGYLPSEQLLEIARSVVRQ